ncbi:MAG: hypothetical protein ACERKN_17135 [Velocimicrobium sp.]
MHEIGEAKIECYIQFGDDEPIDIATLNEKVRDEIGMRLNDTALKAIGYLPDDSV